MQKKYGFDKGVLIVALSDEPDRTVRPFIQRNNVNYVVGSDAGRTSGEFGVRAYPTIVVLDPFGESVYRGHNPIDAERIVEETIRKTPPNVKQLGSGRS